MMGGSLRNEGALNAAINVQDGGVLTNLASDITPGAGGITLGGGAQLQEIAGQINGTITAGDATIGIDLGGEIGGGGTAIIGTGGLTVSMLLGGGATISGATYAILASGVLQLNVWNDSVIEGAVVDTSNQGTLNLWNDGSPATLNMSSFSGFSNINFGLDPQWTLSSWTLEGSAAQFANGVTISGFGAGCTLALVDSAVAYSTVSAHPDIARLSTMSFSAALTETPVASGDVTLAGSGGKLDTSSFSGLSTIDIATGAAWTLTGSAAQLATGEMINGFTLGDEVVLTGASANSGSFVAGTGLVLGGTTLDISGSFATGDFSVTTDGTNTTITETLSVVAPISIVSTTLTTGIQPGYGAYARDVTITNTGALLVPNNLALEIGEGTTVFNAGLIEGGVTMYQARASYYGRPASLTNSGTILAGGEPLNILNATLQNTGSLSGNLFLSLGELSNTGSFSGSVYGGGGTVVNSGSMNVAGGFTVTGSLQNTGTINSGLAGVDLVGVSLFQMINATNAGLITGTANGVVLGKADLTNSGTLYGGGIGAVVSDASSLDNTGTISSAYYGVVTTSYRGSTMAVSITNAGTISGGHDAVLSGLAMDLTIDPGAVFNGTVDDFTDAATLILAGTTAGSLDIANFTGVSNIDFTPGAAWTLSGTAAQLAAGQTISGFGAGDTLVLDGVSASTGTYINGTGLIVGGDTLNLTGSVNITTDGTNTTLTAACFCPGTRIATPCGDVPVENLRIGDEVLTLEGPRRVKWIGHRAYAAAFAGGDFVRPVTLRAGALAEGVPRADLRLSPGHALYLGGGLVQAWRLVNGHSVTQAATAEDVEYYHVELERQEILFANGCQVESFHGTAFRNQFHNAASFAALYPHHEDPPARFPTLTEGFALAAAQARLNARAAIAPPRPTHGPLRGVLELAGPGFVQGWAQDITAPETPVVLNLYAGCRFVARLLANGYRADLRAAGLGSGCHGFTVPLPAIRGAITLRRASDGAILAPLVTQAA